MNKNIAQKYKCKYISAVKKRITLMSLLRKRGKTSNKINQQQQTLIKSKTLCPFKKNNNKFKIASDKTQTEQNDLYFTRKDIRPVDK